jgi:hypothetical protein
VADQAQSTEVLQVALTTAFNHGQDVIRVPQRFPIEPFEAPAHKKPVPVLAPRPLQVEVGSARVGVANCADAVIAPEDLLAQVTRVTTKAPFMDTPDRTERQAPRGNFEPAPAAQGAAIPALLKSGSVDETTGHGPGRTHTNLVLTTIQNKVFRRGAVGRIAVVRKPAGRPRISRVYGSIFDRSEPSKQEKMMPAERAPEGQKDPAHSLLNGVADADTAKVDGFAMGTACGKDHSSI